MVVDERARKALYEALERRIGAEAATTMMELLPPLGWADVTTKEDLRQLELRLKAELRAEMAELRAEMAELRGELRGEMRTMGAALTREIGETARSQFRAFAVTNATTVLAVAGLAFGAAKLA